MAGIYTQTRIEFYTSAYCQQDNQCHPVLHDSYTWFSVKHLKFISNSPHQADWLRVPLYSEECNRHFHWVLNLIMAWHISKFPRLSCPCFLQGYLIFLTVFHHFLAVQGEVEINDMKKKSTQPTRDWHLVAFILQLGWCCISRTSLLLGLHGNPSRIRPRKTKKSAMCYWRLNHNREPYHMRVLTLVLLNR